MTPTIRFDAGHQCRPTSEWLESHGDKLEPVGHHQTQAETTTTTLVGGLQLAAGGASQLLQVVAQTLAWAIGKLLGELLELTRLKRADWREATSAATTLADRPRAPSNR